MKTLKIKQYECIIDDEDADLLKLKWHPLASKKKTAVYVRRSVYDGSVNGKAYTHTEIMHRIILGRVLGRDLEQHEQVDHKDLNGLNNTRSNLRLATGSQNQGNRIGRGKLGVKGVHRWNGRYRATIFLNGKKKHLGMFDTVEEAKAAYKKAAVEYFGEFARFE
jgi:hypothetical protein